MTVVTQWMLDVLDCGIVELDVRARGAVGDDSTDNSPAFQEAVDALEDAGSQDLD